MAAYTENRRVGRERERESRVNAGFSLLSVFRLEFAIALVTVRVYTGARARKAFRRFAQRSGGDSSIGLTNDPVYV